MQASNQGYDSCALMAHLSAHPTRQGIERVLEGLECMEHRTGIVTGESDGVGVMVDVPRDLWAQWVGSAAYAPNFWVAHLSCPSLKRLALWSASRRFWGQTAGAFWRSDSTRCVPKRWEQARDARSRCLCKSQG